MISNLYSKYYTTKTYKLMTKTPQITQAQLNKIFNCQDELKSSFVALSTAAKKLNDTRLTLEREASGQPTTTHGASFYNNLHNKKAVAYSNNLINDVTDKFSTFIAELKKNLGFMKSQNTYLSRINELIHYYKENIKDDDKTIQDRKNTYAIANRMSDYYDKEGDGAKTIIYYMKYIYWSIFGFSLIFLIKNLLFGGYLKVFFSQIKANISNPNSTYRLKYIFPYVDAEKYPLYPWHMLVILFVSVPYVIFPYVINPVIPYIQQYLYPDISHYG